MAILVKKRRCDSGQNSEIFFSLPKKSSAVQLARVSRLRRKESCEIWTEQDG
jgi:hypothetical protein